MTWRNSAACLHENPDLFFPIGTAKPARLQAERAKDVCRRCEVAQKCLKWAMESGPDAGVVGGMSEAERLALSRRHDRARRTGRVAGILAGENRPAPDHPRGPAVDGTAASPDGQERS